MPSHLKTQLNKKKSVFLDEFVCEKCDKFFFTSSDAREALNCPFCQSIMSAWINEKRIEITKKPRKKGFLDE